MIDLSVSSLAFAAHDFSEACDTIAGSGCRHVEPAFVEGYSQLEETELNVKVARQLRLSAEAAGISCRSVSAHVDTGTADAVERMKRRLDFAAALGAQYLISNAGSAGSDRLFAANMGVLGEAARQRGIVICLENPGHGTSLFPDARAMAAWKARIGHPSIDLNYDVGNVFTASDERIDPARDILSLVVSAAHFHLKDVGSDGTGWHICPIGEGSIDYSAILKTFARVRPDAPLCIEMPLHLWRPYRAPARFKPAPSLGEIAMKLRRSVNFIVEALATSTAEQISFQGKHTDVSDN